MSKTLISSLAACAVLTAGAPVAKAHHAAAGLYDRDGTITVTGRVESVFWRNPHVRFTLAVPNDNGGEQIWEIEAGSVNSLERMSVSEDVVAPGGIVTVMGLPGRAGEPIAYAREIVSVEGEEVSIFFTLEALDEHYELERDATAAAGPVDDIFRVWIPVTVPNTGSGRYDFPLTPAAQAIRANWDPANDPALVCVPPGMPAAMDNPYPIEFEDRGDTIVLRLEEWDGVRTIHMNADASDAPAPSPMGYSVGHWEGDTLVVATSRIDYPYFDDLGTPQSEQMQVTERFELDGEAGRLLWTGEITDPEVFTEPVILEIEWHYVPGNARKPYNCAVPE